MSRRAALGAAAVAAATVALFVVSRGKWSDAVVDSGREWIVRRRAVRAGRFSTATSSTGSARSRRISRPRSFACSARASGRSSWPARSRASCPRGCSTRFCAGSRGGAPRLGRPRDSGAALHAQRGGRSLGMGYRIWHAAGFALAGGLLASGAAGPAWRGGALAAPARGWRPVSHRVGRGRGRGGSTGVPRPSRGATGQPVGAALVARLRRDVRRRVGHFVYHAGASAVLDDGHVLLTGLPPATRDASCSRSRVFPTGSAGSPELSTRRRCGREVVLLAARPGSVGAPPRGRPRPLSGSSSALSSCRQRRGGANGAAIFSAAPIVCLAAVVVGVWRRGRPDGAAMAAFGLVGLLASLPPPVSHRRFGVRRSAVALCAGLRGGHAGVLAALGRAGADRRRLRLGYSTGLAILVALAFVWRTAQYAQDLRKPLPGTDGMLSASAPQAREIAAMVEAIRERTQPGDGLVVFPEGQVLNQLTGRIDPLRHKLLIPGYLTAENESAVLEELRRRARERSSCGPGLPMSTGLRSSASTTAAASSSGSRRITKGRSSPPLAGRRSSTCGGARRRRPVERGAHPGLVASPGRLRSRCHGGARSAVSRKVVGPADRFRP